MISAFEAINETRKQIKLQHYNFIVRSNLEKIEDYIKQAINAGVNSIYIAIGQFLYPMNTIEALRDFGYDVHIKNTALKISWGFLGK